MHGVKGQYVMGLYINNEEIPLVEPDFHSVKLIEETGNMLPTMEVIFTLRKIDLINSLREGAVLTVSLGVELSNMMYCNYCLVNRNKISEDNNQIVLRLVGILSNLHYSVPTHVNKFINKNSLDVIKSIISEYFTFSTNIKTTPIDNMNWFQTSISDRQMVTKCWLHSRFSDNNIPMIGITSDNEFRYRGVIETISGLGINSWSFGPHEDVSNPNHLSYSRHPELVASPGYNDFIAGIPKNRIVHNTDTNESTIEVPSAGITISDTEVVETLNVGPKLSTVSIMNSNVHSDYYNARDYNICNLNRLQSFKVKIVVTGSFFRIGVLDRATLTSGKMKDGYVNSELDGNYIVDKVCRIIANRRLTTIVTLCRDSMNNVK
jgi:hypothetical protein